MSKISTFTIYDKFTIYDERYGCKYILYIYIAAMMLKTKLHLLYNKHMIKDMCKYVYIYLQTTVKSKEDISTLK